MPICRATQGKEQYREEAAINGVGRLFVRNERKRLKLKYQWGRRGSAYGMREWPLKGTLKQKCRTGERGCAY